MDESGSKRIQIDLDALIQALQSHGFDAPYFLNTETGVVAFYYDGMLCGEEIEVDEDFDIDDYLDSGPYERIDSLSSHEAFGVMEEFVRELPDGRPKEKLTRALDGRKPFRAFKDALLELGSLRDKWFQFEAESYKTFAQDWLDEREIDAELVAIRLTSQPNA